MTVTSIESPELPPKTVSQFLGIEGSQLPRVTAQTINHPAQPSKKRGGAARYSKLDALLMRFGMGLMTQGLSAGLVQICLEKIKAWLLERLSDPRLGTREEVFAKRDPEYWRWVVVEATETGVEVSLLDRDKFTNRILDRQIGAPYTVVNVHGFMHKEGRRLYDMLYDSGTRIERKVS